MKIPMFACRGTQSISRVSSVLAMPFWLSLIVFSASASTANLDQVIATGDKKLKVAQAAQQQVDKLTEERRELYNEYKAVNKEIEGLKVYNNQLNRQILNQRKEIERIESTIDGGDRNAASDYAFDDSHGGRLETVCGLGHAVFATGAGRSRSSFGAVN